MVASPLGPGLPWNSSFSLKTHTKKTEPGEKQKTFLKGNEISTAISHVKKEFGGSGTPRLPQTPQAP
jgi:hypothetical protein